MGELSARTHAFRGATAEWNEIWEAGPYFERVAALLEGAREHAILVGWQLDSRVRLPGPGGTEALRDKLIRLCEEKRDFQVYLLIWSHASFYVVERERWQSRVWQGAHPRLHLVFDNRHPFGGSHHEKLCLIDGKAALCGGVDLCGDRWDSPAHLYRDDRRSLDGRHETHGPYHDLAVEVDGELCAELQRHVARRWRKLSPIPFPKPAPFKHKLENNTYPVYLSRTVAGLDPGSPIVREIELLYRELIESARERIILEGQYFWSGELADLLIAKMQERRGTGFELVLVLADLRGIRSLTRRMADYELGLLERLTTVARLTGTRLTLAHPYAYGPGPPRAVYVHSKVLVIDDRYLSIGSANFAARALRLDTEVTLTLAGKTERDRARIRGFTGKLLAHWRREPAVALRPVQPALLLRERASRGKRSHLPWQRLFDPTIPPAHPWKRGYRHWRRLLLLAIVLETLAFVRAPAFGFPLLLAQSWWLPVPFALVASLGALVSGPAPMLVAFWIAAASGYFVARAFPARSAARFRHAGPARLGRRRFASNLAATLDPRIGFGAKLAQQGIHCIPVAWFTLATGVILGSVIYGGLKTWVAIAPRAVVESCRALEVPLLALVTALSLAPRARFRSKNLRPTYAAHIEKARP